MSFTFYFFMGQFTLQFYLYILPKYLLYEYYYFVTVLDEILIK